MTDPVSRRIRKLLAGPLLAAVAAFPATAQETADGIPAKSGAASFQYGARPKSPVFDQAKALPADTEAELAAQLEPLRERSGIDVMVVTLPSLGEAPPELVGNRFGDAWGHPLLHCVVLHVPGAPGSPWMIFGGKLVSTISSESVASSVAAANRRVSHENGEPAKILAAATEASDLMRIWVGEGTYLSLRQQAASRESIERQIFWIRLRQIAMPLALGAVGVLAGSGVLFYLLWRARRPLRFPDTTWQQRLGAPYAGGNDATASLIRQSRSSSHRSPTTRQP